MRFAGMNMLAILVAAAAAWLAGGAWYGLLGKQWVAAQGPTMEAFKAKQAASRGTPRAWLPFVLAYVAEVIIAVVLSGILLHLGTWSLRGGLISAAFVWFGFVLTTIVVNNAFSGRSARLSAIDAGHWLVAILLIGAILGTWGP